MWEHGRIQDLYNTDQSICDFNYERVQEGLLALLLSCTCLIFGYQDVFDDEGRRYTPREWFVAPLEAIEEAIKYFVSGEITKYRYDSNLQQIVRK